MSKADHKICYYIKWFNECSIRGAAYLTWFLASLLVFLFLVSLNNKTNKLECVCHSWIGFAGISSSWGFKHWLLRANQHL
jgi:hypothetical protein